MPFSTLYIYISRITSRCYTYMAGLQYYFFPTDFYYPRPPRSATTDTTTITTKAVPAVQKQTDDDDIEMNAASQSYIRRNNNNTIGKAINTVCMQTKPQKQIKLRVEDDQSNHIKPYSPSFTNLHYSLLPDQEPWNNADQ